MSNKKELSEKLTVVDFKKYLRKYRQNEYYCEYVKLLEKLQGKTFFKKSELIEIARWKLKEHKKHKNRVIGNIRLNKWDKIVKATRSAFNSKRDEDKFEILEKLSGVRVPIASTILTFHDPKKFAIFDKHVWKVLWHLKLIDESLGVKKNYGTTPPSTNYYKIFIKIIRDIAKREGLTPREAEMALFEYGRELK